MENKDFKESSPKKKISLAEIYPVISQKLEAGGSVELPITGTSMLPLLVWGRDTVTVKKQTDYKKYDIIFYRRDNGQFVLHRIIGKNGKGFILCGDNQTTREYGIENRHIIGAVTDINRNGRRFSVLRSFYRFYSKIWLFLMPVRKPLLLILRKTGLIKIKNNGLS